MSNLLGHWWGEYAYVAELEGIELGGLKQSTCMELMYEEPGSDVNPLTEKVRTYPWSRNSEIVMPSDRVGLVIDPSIPGKYPQLTGLFGSPSHVALIVALPVTACD